MDHDTTRDKKSEENEIYEGAHPELQDLPLPATDNMLYSILNSLNQNIADFHAYLKFKNYISDETLNTELLKRSMSIHRDFSALFLHTKEELVFIYPELLEKAERILFKGEAGTDFIKYTCKMGKLIDVYKTTLYREGYLPDFKWQFMSSDI
ncbi:hypothetical protein MSSAC_1113 [Methanosarcina siciliae C2J]|uniref:Uncharacterized protein n=3 Tax=Methanosarcina siciliae TaxID=38027 RepID=A0A0E3PBY1_9EURY|nr:hypothetical protein [Methanosarcina siciliae]AKB27878.1 hypothetical protein MSSIT_1159 [Methanosarcina siciliae T4/M]AKB31802.1 hypothetical protein MSSIH_1112 [Methanosarcina siciliae HI350]AKB35703.1 hypothetical protein MSSAC_1113 [Methanosarcina siciliae C2J]